jgi:hypothetical protein
MSELQKLQKIALGLLSNLRGVDFDLAVYKAVLHLMVGPERASQMESLLQDARKDPVLRKAVLEKYEPIRKGLERPWQTDTDKALLQAMKFWPPSSLEN